MTRASLINLAVYSEGPDSLEKNTQMIAQITENHACRAHRDWSDPGAKENGSKPGSPRIVTSAVRAANKFARNRFHFRLQGPCAKLLAQHRLFPSRFRPAVLSLVAGRISEPMDPQLWAWVDRLIYRQPDMERFSTSRCAWSKPREQEAKQRIVLCDLNWTRLDKIRFALAQFFDHPASHHHFAEMESVTVDFAPGYKSTAILLIGWLAAQLKWKTNQQQMNGSCRFLDSNDRKIDIELREKSGNPIGEVVLNSQQTKFCVTPAKCGDLLEVWRSGENETAKPQMMPAQSNDPVDLMTQELLRGGPHRVYLRAVNAVRVIAR